MIDNFSHGGNIYKYAKLLKCLPTEIIDLSSNIIDYPIIDIDELIINYKDYIKCLPSPYASLLKDTISKHNNLEKDNITTSCGTSELIKNICIIFQNKNALIFTPTYIDYEKQASIYNLNIKYKNLKPENNFLLNLNEINLLDIDIVFICNPNNPTGTIIDKEIILNKIKENPKTFFVIDESYLPFLENEDKFTLLNATYENLIVLRSFSKIFGLAGLRAGYAYSYNKEIIKKLEAYSLEWGISSLSEQIIIRILENNNQNSLNNYFHNKEYFLNELSLIPNILFYNPSANFVLIKLLKHNSNIIFEKLLENKILIRDCSNINGLDDSFIRVSIKRKVYMKKFLEIFKGIMNE